jgi:hypothetical protein
MGESTAGRGDGQYPAEYRQPVVRSTIFDD